MNLLISKFIYPEDMDRIEQVLKSFSDLAIQLAFFKRADFMNFDHLKIKECASQLNISIPIIHAPTCDVFHENFINILKTIKEIYKVKIISIHPQRGVVEEALKKLEELKNKILALDIILAYENFYPTKHAKEKWIYLPEDMYERFASPNLKITYDCAHTLVDDNTLEKFEKILDKVEVVHLSNRSGGREHLPIEQGEFPIFGLLDILSRKNFQGYIVLEYMPEYEFKLFEDLEKVKKYIEA
ncbi:MAG: TIM barrel protein [Candidatus Thermoplasmatota archaeon]